MNKDLFINFIVIFILVCFFTHIVYNKLYKKISKENFSNISSLGQCADIYPKWARTQDEHFEKKYPECFTDEHYDKIRDVLTKTFKKILKFNVPIEAVCSILNNVINKEIKNPKAVNIFYEAFPTCQQLKNFNVDKFVDDVLSNNVEDYQYQIEDGIDDNDEDITIENFENKKINKRINLEGVNFDMNQILKIIKKKYPNKNINDIEFNIETKESFKQNNQEEEELNNVSNKQEESNLSSKELMKLDNISDLTLTQYKKWLNLFKETPEKLSQIHINNLQKIINGNKLQLKDLPSHVYQKILFSDFIERKNLDDIIKIEKNAAYARFDNIDKNKASEYIKDLKYIDLENEDRNVYGNYGIDELIFNQPKYKKLNLNKKNPFEIDEYLRPKI